MFKVDVIIVLFVMLMVVYVVFEFVKVFGILFFLIDFGW